jgi:hypothetical protein
LQKFIARNNKENAWYFQEHDIRTYVPALHAGDMLKLNLNPIRFPLMTPFYASALETWHNMKPIVNPNLQSLEHSRCSPMWNSTLLTPHISGHKLVFDEAWSALNIIYIHWKNILILNMIKIKIPFLCNTWFIIYSF